MSRVLMLLALMCLVFLCCQPPMCHSGMVVVAGLWHATVTCIDETWHPLYLCDLFSAAAVAFCASDHGLPCVRMMLLLARATPWVVDLLGEMRSYIWIGRVADGAKTKLRLVPQLVFVNIMGGILYGLS